MARIYMISILLLVAGNLSCFAGSSSLTVSATILSKNQCKFNPPNNRTIAFGNLNPLAPADVTRQVTIGFVCNGKDDIASYFVGDDDGLHESGPGSHRMEHLSLPGVYLPYAFTFSPATGDAPKGVDQILTITGTIIGNDYQMALAGNYMDRVTLSIDP